MVGERGCTSRRVARVTGRIAPENGRCTQSPASPYIERRTPAIRRGGIGSKDVGRARCRSGAELLPLVPVDVPSGRDHARGPAARGATRGFPAWLKVGGPAWPNCSVRCPSAVPLESRRSNRSSATATAGTRSSSTPRTPCRCPPTCSSPTAGSAGGPPSWPATATAPARPRRWASSTPTPPTATTPCSWSARATWCWARPAVLRRAPGLEPRRPLRLRHQPGPRRHGRLEPAGPERLGPGALASTCSAITPWSTPLASAWSASPTGAP